MKPWHKAVIEEEMRLIHQTQRDSFWNGFWTAIACGLIGALAGAAMYAGWVADLPDWLK